MNELKPYRAETAKKLGSMIRDNRQAQKLTQQDLGDLVRMKVIEEDPKFAGISPDFVIEQKMVSRIEHGEADIFDQILFLKALGIEFTCDLL